jgi:ATP-dependent exoDNAse (exonuclease V) beta subunit
MRFLSNRKDQVSLAHVYSEYYQYFSNDESLNFLEWKLKDKMDEFIRTAVIIKSFPLQILVDHIIRFFDLEKEINESIFLQHFKDAVYDYRRNNADDLSNFMEWWEESFDKFQVEVPQNERSLKIITIHKSKGLEFDVVFIPFAQWSLDSSGTKADTLWLDFNEDGIKTIPVKYDKRMQNSLFNKEYLETKFNNYLDKLNLLYVATTRAVRELYIYSDRPKLFILKHYKPNIRTIFNYIIEQDYPLEGELYLKLSDYRLQDTQEIIVGQRTLPDQHLAAKDIETIEVGLHSTNIFESVAIKQQSVDLRDSKNMLYDGSKQTGIHFHHIIANAKSLKEAYQMLNKLLLQRKINQIQFDRFKIDLKELFSHPNIIEWMGNYKSYSEYSLCLEDKILKPDKFFVSERHCVVVDFKTGKSKPEYVEQVASYCHAVNALFMRPVSGYIYYTQTGKLELVA